MPIRFTTPGDTVLGFGMKSKELPEIALARGRHMELYRADESTKGSVKERIDNAFLESYSSGNFQVERQDRVSRYVARA